MIGKKYIYKINIVVEDDIDNQEVQSKIDDLLESISKELSKVNAKQVSVQFNDLSNNRNCGKCSNCGTWCSDWTEEDSVQELSNGAVVDNMWQCDLCLPKDHDNYF